MTDFRMFRTFEFSRIFAHFLSIIISQGIIGTIIRMVATTIKFICSYIDSNMKRYNNDVWNCGSIDSNSNSNILTLTPHLLNIMNTLSCYHILTFSNDVYWTGLEIHAVFSIQASYYGLYDIMVS